MTDLEKARYDARINHWYERMTFETGEDVWQEYLANCIRIHIAGAAGEKCDDLFFRGGAILRHMSEWKEKEKGEQDGEKEG